MPTLLRPPRPPSWLQRHCPRPPDDGTWSWLECFAWYDAQPWWRRAQIDFCDAPLCALMWWAMVAMAALIVALTVVQALGYMPERWQ